MCLYSKSKYPKIATKPIHTYKVIINYNNNWVSAFIGSHFTYGYLKNTEPKSVVRADWHKVFYLVSKGFFHSSLNYSTAKNYLK